MANSYEIRKFKVPKELKSLKQLSRTFDSSHAFVNAMYAEPFNENVSTEPVVRKLLSQYLQEKHNNFPVSGGTTEFVSSVFAAADGLKASMVDTNLIHGYVQVMSICPELQIKRG